VEKPEETKVKIDDLVGEVERQDTITYTFYQLSKYDENWHPEDDSSNG